MKEFVYTYVTLAIVELAMKDRAFHMVEVFLVVVFANSGQEAL